MPSLLVMMSRVGGRDVSLGSAARRVSQLHRALSWRPLSASCRLCSSTLGGTGGEKGGEEGRSLHLVTSFCSIWVIFQAACYVCSQTFISEATVQCMYLTTTEFILSKLCHFISRYMAILSWLDNQAQVDQIEFRNYDVIRVRVRLAKFNVVCSFYLI